MHEQLLKAYDDQLRGAVEVRDEDGVERIGPLWLARFRGDRGFVTYRELPDDRAGIADLVDAAVRHFRDDTDVVSFEWKSRAHDRAPGLAQALAAHGLVADEPESIMIGEADALNVEVATPEEIDIRPATSEADVRAASEMQGRVFGDPHWPSRAEDAVRRLAAGEDLGLWIATARGAVVSAGRLIPVHGTDFAGIWGGATVPEWRHRGIYRALTARRAAQALAQGKTLIHSDSTEYSRPILERSGFVAVSTTTPYIWTR